MMKVSFNSKDWLAIILELLKALYHNNKNK